VKCVRLLKDGRVLVETVEVAELLTDRARGLLGRASLGSGRALRLVPCGSIHTFGMKFPIDIYFLSAGLRVVRVVRNLPANRLAWGGWGADSTVEMESGWLPDGVLQVGDRVQFEDAE
jgi:uncharacterized protein